MKKGLLLLMLLSLLGMGTEGLAQKWDRDLVVKKGYVFKDEQVMELRRGKLSPLKKEVKLKNGYTLQLNGSLVSEAGIRRGLREGEGVDKDGHILFSGKRNGLLVLLEDPTTFYAANGYSNGKKVRTVTGVDPRDIPIGGPGHKVSATNLPE